MIVPFASASKAFCSSKPLRYSAAARRGRRSPSPVLVGLLELRATAAHRAWRRQMATLRPVAGSCGPRAPEGLMDSKDLLMLAASVMRSISLIARPARWPAGTVVGCHSVHADNDRRATAALPHWASAPRRRRAGAVPGSPRAVGGRHGHVPAALILLVLNLDNSSETSGSETPGWHAVGSLSNRASART